MATYPAMMAHPPVHHVVYTVPHVNQAWTALHEVPYERFHEGGPAVLVSNGTTASYVPPHHIIKTQAFQQALPVYASCPHFVQLGTCMLGASCGLVHPVKLRVPVLPAYGASFSAYTASLSLSPSVSPLLESYQQHPASMPPSLVYMPPSMEPQQLPFVEPLFAPTGTTIAVPRDQLAGSTLRRLAPAKAPKVRPLKFSGNRQRRGNKPLVIPPPAAGDTEPGPRQLIVNYLAPRVDTAGLRKLFEAFGELEDALVMTDRTGASRGFGFVVFKRCADAVTAIESASGRVLLGKRVRLGYLNPQYPVNEGKSLADVAMTLEPLLDDDSEDEYHSDHQQSASFLEDTQCSGASSYTTRRSSQSAVDLLDASDVADDPFRV